MNMHCEPQIHLFVASHKEVWIPQAECIVPLRTDQKSGDNISDKTDYCELRAQYWVWKNARILDEDYVGFFHYRRYLDFNPAKCRPCPVKDKNPLPYSIQKRPNEQNYNRAFILPAVAGFDVIAPIWEYTGLTVWERYGRSTGHHAADLQLIYQIIAEKYPDFCHAADIYLNGLGEYYGNIYVMRWPLFRQYCSWIFDILDEFDARSKCPSAHANGYLGERLFGIYFTWLKSQPSLSCGEYPRIHFSCYDDERHSMFFKAFGNMILPPGSRKRGKVLQIVSKFRKKET